VIRDDKLLTASSYDNLVVKEPLIVITPALTVTKKLFENKLKIN
jgi:hypothetical protein